MKTIDQFNAKGESGRVYTITVSTDSIDVSTHDDPSSSLPGMKSAKTDEGYHVNNLGNNKYLIVEIGEVVERI